MLLKCGDCIREGETGTWAARMPFARSSCPSVSYSAKLFCSPTDVLMNEFKGCQSNVCRIRSDLAQADFNVTT